MSSDDELDELSERDQRLLEDTISRMPDMIQRAEDQRNFGHLSPDHLLNIMAGRSEDNKILERRISRLRVVIRLLVVGLAVAVAFAAWLGVALSER
jgi:hypothetical protein